MEDQEFLRRMKQRLEEGTGAPVEVELGQGQEGSVTVDFSGPVARVVMASDALEHAGLARMYMQYAILSLRERRQVSEEEFLLFLRRN
jgi:hypothetical protein